MAGVVLGAPIEGQEDTWAAIDTAGTAREVVVLALSPDPAVRRAVLDALRPLLGAGLGHRQEVVDVTACRNGVAAVLTPLAGARLAESRFGRRPRTLAPGQIVALGVPIARELADLHARQIVFGASELREEVVLDADGRPHLAVGRFISRRAHAVVDISGGGAGPGDDVRALQALLRGLARSDGSRTTRRLAAVYRAADCAAVGEALRRVARPIPLVGGGRSGPRRYRWGSKVSWHPRMTGVRIRIAKPLVFGAAVALVGCIGWWSVGGRGAAVLPADGAQAAADDPVASPTSASGSSTPTTSDWATVVDELDARRASAFAGGTQLDEVDTPTGSAYAEDMDRWKGLQDSGLHADGFAPTVRSVRLVSDEGSRARLEVVDTLPAYRLVDGSGAVRATAPARGETIWEITLARSPDPAAAWRFEAVAPR